MIAQIEIDCGQMSVTHLRKGVMITAELPCRGVLTLPPNPNAIAFQPVRLDFSITFPPTEVDELNFIHYMVKPTPADGLFDAGGTIHLELPEEPVGPKFKIFPPSFKMVAEEITAYGTVVLADGTKGMAKVVFPDAPSTWQKPGEWMVGAVTATGTVTF